MTEQKPKHTPGPWQFYADLPSTEPNWHIVTNANRMRVLANVHIEPGNAMDLANAHLIAAAPTMYEVLAAIAGRGRHRGMLMLDCEELCRIDAAIARATGDN